MLIINNVKVHLDADFEKLLDIVAKKIQIPKNEILEIQLYRKSVDARKKNDVNFCCSVILKARCEEKILKKCKDASVFSQYKYFWKKADRTPPLRPVIVGFGPAGIFAALTLSRAGLCPLVLERGEDVDTRSCDVENFFETGLLKEESNVQFGEGGAGTFSDGKLNTGIKDPRCRVVLETFVEFGADKDILTDSKPHIGTDVLKGVVKNIRKEIIRLGGEVKFGAKLEDINIFENRVSGITVNGEKINCDTLLLCIGHSARDTFKMLKNKGLCMIRKPFAMGVRIEHKQADINRALYGDFAQHKSLGAADYKLAVHLENGRGVYTFCMCPGGEGINASSEAGAIAVNGMSNSRRDGINANSAVLVGINPEDIDGDDVLAGCELQRRIEQSAYNLDMGAVPITTVGHFVFGKENALGRILPTVRPKTVFCNLEEIYPAFITESLKEGIKRFNKKIEGFADFDAVITAPETRSSCPVRILRGENGQSKSHNGIYPCGEGAGYAGGIMSAAVDGIHQAEKIIETLNQM
ncbi:MAG: hypothetical protein J6D52_02350 [Clostridia bacterium]|nr:hypothetical protein [Clostridia bacterium]